jgi:hypothetical protein
MIKSYGKVIIEEGSILYHTSDELFQYKNNSDKPMLFCTFHPSEWDVTNEYVTYIKLKKNISLLFMIEECKKTKIYSSLNLFTNHPNLNLAKKHNDQLSCYVKELKKENLDGWITSIENKTSVEVALINNLTLFEFIKTEKLRRNWRNGYLKKEEKILKKWGKKYIISTIERPLKLYLNERYINMIEEYKKYEIISGYLKEYIFQVVLNNAIIYYHKNKIDKIEWKC